jgi:Fe-S oxidoreductase/nitrate reductase gamma subunit
MYLLFIIALLVFSYGIYKRVRFYLNGQPDKERTNNLPLRLFLMSKEMIKRLILMAKEILLQNRVRNSIFPALFLSFIFYSFAILIITTAIIALDYDFGTSLFNGYVYVFFTLLSEIAGILVLVGIFMAAYRRYIKRPETIETKAGDTVALVLLFFIIITGFLIEGLRIATAGDKWAFLSFGGLATSKLFSGISEESGRALHKFFWWLHAVLTMGWIATIPFTKFIHILTLPANVFFAKLKPRGELKRVDIEALMTSDDFDEENFKIGVDKGSDFTWKQRLDIDACISCGRCEEVCPAYLAKQPFSPKKMIAHFKNAVIKAEEALKKAPLNPAKSLGAAAAEAPAEANIEEPDIIPNEMDEEFIWLCRTCTACMEVCPAFVEHVDDMIELRRNEVIMKGRMPAEAARTLKRLESIGNPFAPQSDRVDWIKQLNVRVVDAGEEVDVLYWIGCCTTFDPTKQKIAVDLSKILKKCGIDFGVLGEDEKCCGDPARLMGQEQLFQELAKQQIELIKSRKFKILLTNCPHCYNVLKHEYRQFGADFNVVHHSEFLHEMLWLGKLVPQLGEKGKYAYHDPCYLGRYQKIYDSPREIVKSIPGAELVEMKNHREESLCCGGGGGHFWMDIKKGERINNLRVNQAKEAGADTIITSCAYCQQMLDDSVKVLNMDEDIRVVDIATLVLRSLGEN